MLASSADAVAAIQIQIEFSAEQLACSPTGLMIGIRDSETQISNMVRVTSEASIKEMRPISAVWLQQVTQRISDSIAPSGSDAKEDLRWLSADIAEAARSFFADASDVLPCEPYIYRSRKGELVAEFETSHGSLTTLISLTNVIAFAAMGDTILEQRLDLGPRSIATLRKELNRMSVMLSTGRAHGNEVESSN